MGRGSIRCQEDSLRTSPPSPYPPLRFVPGPLSGPPVYTRTDIGRQRRVSKNKRKEISGSTVPSPISNLFPSPSPCSLLGRTDTGHGLDRLWGRGNSVRYRGGRWEGAEDGGPG